MRFHWWDRIRDWIVLVALLLASVTMMLAHNDPVMRNLRALSLDFVSRIETRFTWAGQFTRTIEENALLRRDNVLLSSQLARLNVARMENVQLEHALGFKQEAAYDMVAARIVSKDIFGQENFLTLNVGAADGIEIDMAVVSNHGILGRVVLVSKNYCRVLSYLNTGFRVPVDVLPSFGVGMISWSGLRPDMLALENMVKTVAVGIGDTAVTSSTSRIFPPGYLVGTVTAVDTLPGLNYLDVAVRPAADIGSAQYAFVLLYQDEEERYRLESEEIR